jgi:hypothetical protein
MNLEHFPVPGNLREQSKSHRQAKICQRRRRGIVAADALAFVAKNCEAAGVAFLAHALQGFASASKTISRLICSSSAMNVPSHKV